MPEPYYKPCRELDDGNELLIGYCIGSKWWNKGYTSEAFAAIIPFFFNDVKVGRIGLLTEDYFEAKELLA